MNLKHMLGDIINKYAATYAFCCGETIISSCESKLVREPKWDKCFASYR